MFVPWVLEELCCGELNVVVRVEYCGDLGYESYFRGEGCCVWNCGVILVYDVEKVELLSSFIFISEIF